MSNRLLKSVLSTVLLATAGCVAGVDPQLRDANAPETWQRVADATRVDNDWLASFGDETLDALAAETLTRNFLLAEERARLEQAAQTLATTKAAALPVVSLGIDASRRQIAIRDFSQELSLGVIDQSFGLGLDVRWQADIWGELSDASRSAALRYAASEARFLDLRRSLIADTARAWYQLLETRKLLEVAEQRLSNAQQSLAIVESGYLQGLNEALDLYLARNTVEQQNANLANQQQLALEAAARLQLLGAAYPDGDVAANGDLPLLAGDIGIGVPGELVSRRADLQEAWLQLMAADADLAVAHKQRFPSLIIVGSASDNARQIGDVFDGEPLAWSLLGSITQPLFEGGRLRAAERRADARVTELEQGYLRLVNIAFAEVEDGVSRAQSLAEQYSAIVASRDNADAALDLALDQYSRGLVTYNSVLQAQQRAFDARVGVVQLQGQQLQNRIDLYQALGGAYDANDAMEARL